MSRLRRPLSPRARALALLLAALASIGPVAEAIGQPARPPDGRGSRPVYKWTDESGAIHLDDDINNVPERSRPRAEEVMRTPEGAAPARAPAAGGSRSRAAVAPRSAADRWQGRTLAEWQGDLREGAPRVRAAALTALGFFGEPAVPLLVEGLRDPDALARVSAARALGHVGPGATEAIAPLVQALRDSDSRVRFDAAVALGRVGPPARGAVPALLRALRDPAGEVRVGAALGLGGLGAAAQDAISPLVESLRDGNPVLRMSAASALGGIGPAAARAVPPLIAALHDPNTSVRTSAAKALGAMGSSARAAVGELRGLAEGDDVDGAARGRLSREQQDALRQELRVAARQAVRQIEGR